MSESDTTVVTLLSRYRYLLYPGPDAPATPAWPAPGAAEAHDRALGCLLGLAVGEAMGAVAEGKERGSFPPVAAPSGGGALGLAPGVWGDATASALCLAESMLSWRTVDLEDFLLRLGAWVETGAGAAAGRALDADPAIRPAVARFAAEGAFPSVGAPEGNGALLRMAPLAIFAARDPEVAAALAVRQSRATHAGVASLDACRLFAAQLADALNGGDREAVLRPRVMGLCPRVLFVNGGAWREKPREAITASGEVVETLEAGLWAVAQGGNFRDTVRAAAGLGGNAMGAAAVAGQLAGALYGAAAIPAKWLAALAERDRIEFIADDLFQARLAAP